MNEDLLGYMNKNSGKENTADVEAEDKKEDLSSEPSKVEETEETAQESQGETISYLEWLERYEKGCKEEAALKEQVDQCKKIFESSRDERESEERKIKGKAEQERQDCLNKVSEYKKELDQNKQAYEKEANYLEMSEQEWERNDKEISDEIEKFNAFVDQSGGKYTATNEDALKIINLEKRAEEEITKRETLEQQRIKVKKDKEELDQAELQFADMQKESDNTILQIDQRIKQDFSDGSSMHASETEDNILREVRQRYEQADQNLQDAQQKLDEQQKVVDECKNALFNYKGYVKLNNQDPSLTDFITFKQGLQGDESIYILNHDYDWVNFKYNADPEDDTCTVLEEIIWRLIEGFELTNSPKLLQFHIIDEIGHGWGLMNHPKLRDMINIVEDARSYKAGGCYVYGDDNIQILLNYLIAQQNEIVKEFQKDRNRVIQADVENHPQDSYIYCVNKALRNPLEGIDPTDPYTYKVLFILIPPEQDDYMGSTNMQNLFRQISGPLSHSGIIPFFFSNEDSINEKYRKYTDKCKQSYKINLDDDSLAEA